MQRLNVLDGFAEPPLPPGHPPPPQPWPGVPGGECPRAAGSGAQPRQASSVDRGEAGEPRRGRSLLAMSLGKESGCSQSLLKCPFQGQVSL